MKGFFKKISRRLTNSIKSLYAIVRMYWKLVLKVILALIVLVILSFAIWVATFYSQKPQKEKQEQILDDKNNNIVRDITGLYPIKVLDVIVPHTTEEIQQAVKTHGKVSIGGGRYSMGGQTASEKAVQIDMREFNKILTLSTSTKEITVQAGIRWRDIQDRIDPENLSIKVMQTYSNFTVGGSLSVNVHGRYIGLGPVIMSVVKIQLVLADGQIVYASPSEHKDLFYSAIGGMGGIGVITEVTLSLDDNVNVERERVKMPVSEYKKYFFDTIRSSSDVIFHNGDIYPMDFDSISAVSWKKTDKPVTTATKLIPRAKDYVLERIAWVVMSEWPFGKWIREYILEPLIYSKDEVHSRNYEASYDVAELEPVSRKDTTYVLQEYFIPVEQFDTFYSKMKDVFVKNKVNVLNVSIRHANQDPGALLAWAKKEVFAFVVYYKQGTDQKSKDDVAKWTRQMIDEAITVGGTYYLPYQPVATDEQFHRAYPGAIQYFEIKKHYDPTDKFTNNLWDTYYSPEKLEKYKEIQNASALASSTLLSAQTYVRNTDNIYLTLPEWYIVYSAGEEANVLEGGLPSQFDYRKASNEYWSEYKKADSYIANSNAENSDYRLVLRVIGYSFSFENWVKWIYENTVGRISEWFSGNVQVEEDIFAAHVARDYEKFIYDYPWYDFPYNKYYEELHSLPDLKSHHSFGESVRRIERKMFLSLELTVKTFYSWVIRTATHAKFGVQDDIITALVKEEGTYGEISAPHYQPFTVALKAKLAEAYEAKKDFEVLEIAGNDKITLCYLDQVGAAVPSLSKEILRVSEVRSVTNGVAVSKDRITIEVSVENIDDVYAALREKNIEIEHFYDY